MKRKWLLYGILFSFLFCWQGEDRLLAGGGDNDKKDCYYIFGMKVGCDPWSDSGWENYNGGIGTYDRPVRQGFTKYGIKRTLNGVTVETICAGGFKAKWHKGFSTLYRKAWEGSTDKKRLWCNTFYVGPNYTYTQIASASTSDWHHWSFWTPFDAKLSRLLSASVNPDNIREDPSLAGDIVRACGDLCGNAASGADFVGWTSYASGIYNAFKFIYTKYEFDRVHREYMGKREDLTHKGDGRYLNSIAQITNAMLLDKMDLSLKGMVRFQNQLPASMKNQITGEWTKTTLTLLGTDHAPVSADESGRYSFSNIVPGTYQIQAEIGNLQLQKEVTITLEDLFYPITVPALEFSSSPPTIENMVVTPVTNDPNAEINDVNTYVSAVAASGSAISQYEFIPTCSISCDGLGSFSPDGINPYQGVWNFPNFVGEDGSLIKLYTKVIDNNGLFSMDELELYNVPYVTDQILLDYLGSLAEGNVECAKPRLWNYHGTVGVLANIDPACNIAAPLTWGTHVWSKKSWSSSP